MVKNLKIILVWITAFCAWGALFLLYSVSYASSTESSALSGFPINRQNFILNFGWVEHDKAESTAPFAVCDSVTTKVISRGMPFAYYYHERGCIQPIEKSNTAAIALNLILAGGIASAVAFAWYRYMNSKR